MWVIEDHRAARAERSKWFGRVEIACVTLGTGGSVALAAAAALPAVGIPVALLTFAGWSVNRWRNQPNPRRSLGGASMLMYPVRRLDWLEPSPA